MTRPTTPTFRLELAGSTSIEIDLRLNPDGQVSGRFRLMGLILSETPDPTSPLAEFLHALAGRVANDGGDEADDANHADDESNDNHEADTIDEADGEAQPRPTVWRVTAEHTRGRSVAHACTRGLYDDPANALPMLVVAEHEATAIDVGQRELLALVEASEPCDCIRRLQPGSGSWWDSVAIVAERVEVNGDDLS